MMPKDTKHWNNSLIYFVLYKTIHFDLIANTLPRLYYDTKVRKYFFQSYLVKTLYIRTQSEPAQKVTVTRNVLLSFLGSHTTHIDNRAHGSTKANNDLPKWLDRIFSLQNMEYMFVQAKNDARGQWNRETSEFESYWIKYLTVMDKCC